MAQAPPLSAVDAQALGRAYQLLQSGQIDEATGIAQDVANRSPRAADAHHLVALCRRRAGDLTGARAAFDEALRFAPDDPQMLMNSASLLRRLGEIETAVARYRQALAVRPDHGEAWMSLGLALLDQHDVAGALTAAQRAVELRPTSSAAWHALGLARRQDNDMERAQAALRRAVELDNKNAGAWIMLGVTRRLLGDPADALACYARARAADYAGPELADAEAGARLDLGETDAALEGARALTRSAPAYVPGHVMLSEMLWQTRSNEHPLDAFRQAVGQQPAHRALRAAFAQVLQQAGEHAEALTHLHILRAQADEPALVLAQADVLNALGEGDAVDKIFHETLGQMGDARHFRTAYARHLIRAHRPDEAAKQALLAVEREPLDQEAYALLSVAWRLLDDPLEHWLCDYEHLVMLGDIEPPARFSDVHSYLDHLAATLAALHVAKREPINQSLRQGSQTSGILFGRPDPVIAEAERVLAQARDKLLAALPEDPEHPFLRRKTASARVVGSWSVRLWSSGRHVNHFHPEGWLSSAFYVMLPPSVLNEQTGEGCITFGQPPDELGLDLAPRRIVQPKPGRLVIFPSYMWHGTTPFTDAHTPRMTIAFDALPA